MTLPAIAADKRMHFWALLILSVIASFAWGLLGFLLTFLVGFLLHKKFSQIFGLWQRVAITFVFGTIMNLCKEWWDTGQLNSIYPWGPIKVPIMGDLPFFGPKSVATGWDWLDFLFGTMGLIAGLGIYIFFMTVPKAVEEKIVEALDEEVEEDVVKEDDE